MEDPVIPVHPLFLLYRSFWKVQNALLSINNNTWLISGIRVADQGDRKQQIV
jgi:hypothetical protein